MSAQQERATRTRLALLRSAAEIFDRSGYAHAKLRDISTGAGVSPGALHFHYENKAAVAAAVEAAAAQTLWGAGQIAYQENAYALQALTDISHVFALLLRWDVVARAGFRLSDDLGRGEPRDLTQDWRSCIERLLTEAARNEELAPHVRVSEMTCTIVTATTGIGMLIKGRHERRSGLALRGFWRVFLPGLARSGTAARLDPAGTTWVIDKAAGVSACVPRDAEQEALALPPA